MSRNPDHEPKTLADDLRGRTDSELADVFRLRADLAQPIPSDFRALTIRAATGPSIGRFLDSIDALHHFVLRIACDLTLKGSTTEERIVEAVVQAMSSDVCAAAWTAVAHLRAGAVLWGSPDRTHVVTAVREQMTAVPPPTWPSPNGLGAPTPVAVQRSCIEGASNASHLVEVVEEIVHHWGIDPAPVLRSGGLPVKEVQRWSDRLGKDAEYVCFAMDLAHSTHLVAHGATDNDIRWMPTAEFNTWRSHKRSQRWALLAQAWLHTHSVSGLRPFVESSSTFVSTWRNQFLACLAAAGEIQDIASSTAVMDYRWPRRRGAERNRVVERTWKEAHNLGLISHGIVTDFGRVLVAGQRVPSIAHALAQNLPKDESTAYIQADHTIVVTSPLTPQLAGRLHDMADVESRGHATVFRITDASLRRALALDPNVDSWLDSLRDLQGGPVPQPVEYRITDAARSPVPARLRYQAPTPPRLGRKLSDHSTPARVDRAVRTVRESRSTTDRIPAREPSTRDQAPMDSATISSIIRRAIDHHHSLTVEHVESDGIVTSTTIDPIQWSNGSLLAFDHARESVRNFALSRIVIANELSR